MCLIFGGNCLCSSCCLPDGSDDPVKGTQLVEIYALEIQVTSRRALFSRCRRVMVQAVSVQRWLAGCVLVLPWPPVVACAFSPVHLPALRGLQ